MGDSLAYKTCRRSTYIFKLLKVYWGDNSFPISTLNGNGKYCKVNKTKKYIFCCCLQERNISKKNERQPRSNKVNLITSWSQLQQGFVVKICKTKFLLLSGYCLISEFAGYLQLQNPLEFNGTYFLLFPKKGTLLTSKPFSTRTNY